MRPILFAFLVIAIAQGPAIAETRVPVESTLTVQGQGRTQVPPDRAALTVEVVTTGKSLEAATVAHRERAERAAKALKDMAADGLKVDHSTFNLNENRLPIVPGNQPAPESIEYRATTTFELKLDKLEAVDRVVTAIASTGLFEVRNIRFGIGDRNPGLKAARKGAVDDAKDKAATYAEAASVQLDNILSIEENGAGGAPEFAAAAPMMRTGKVIPPETLTLTASVTMTWRIGPKT